jgi:hypothetical protein
VSVKRVESRTHLGDEPQEPGEREGTLPEAVRERATGHELEHEVGTTVGLTGGEDRNQASVPNLLGHAKLPLESRPEGSVVGECRAEQLHGHEAAVRGPGTVDDARGTLPELVLELVLADSPDDGHVRILSAEAREA